jgi:hypothetical protein
MCSILCWILSIWEALGWIFGILAWFMHCQQGGEVWAWNGLLHSFRRFPSSFELFELWQFPRWHRPDRWGAPVWPVRVELMQLLCFMRWFSCIHPVGVALVHGELARVQGKLFVVFVFWFGGLHSLLEPSFVSDVSSRCSCLRGPRLVLFKWSCSLSLFGFRSLVRVSFYLFLFFFFSLRLLFVGVVNALMKGEIEDRVWFEDRWMVASWCDEWLTTLCRLILG